MCTEEKCTTNGGWSAWGEFTACSVTCVPTGGGGGGGTKSRFRRCDSPPPSDGGLFCVGRAIDIQGSRSISILPYVSRKGCVLPRPGPQTECASSRNLAKPYLRRHKVIAYSKVL